MIKLDGNIGVADEDLNIKELMGWKYSLPSSYLKAQSRLPGVYRTTGLKLVDYSKEGEIVYWPEVEMILQLCQVYKPISWKLIQRLVCDDSYMPLDWIEHLVGGGEIVFPHALCYKRNDKNLDTVVCAAIDYDPDSRRIECYGVKLWEIRPDMRLALYTT
jgi:hypothetical protein